MAFVAAEAREIHSLCTRCSIPVEHFGAVLTPAQRVYVLVQAYETLREQLGMRELKA